MPATVPPPATFSAPSADLAHRFTAMGSPCEIRLQSTAADGDRHLKALRQTLLDDLARLEQRYSRYRPDSLLSAINRAAAEGGSLEVDEETAGLLDYAATCYAQSDGLFDITAGLYNQVWHFEKDQALPDLAALRAELQSLSTRIGWTRVIWQRPQLRFSVAGMALDLGGIVKEYAADRAASLCLAAGVTHGYINLGGDLRLLGPQTDGRPWQIGISHPRQPGQLLTTLALGQGAVASSGDYERCREIAGIRYSHLLDPHSGWPVQGLAAVTVLAPLCVVAGSAATIAMLKGEAGPQWLQALGLPHCWVDVYGRCGGDLALD